MNAKDIVASVSAIASPECERLGLELWDVVYRKEGGRQVLRLIIDKPGGVFIDDCENLSRAADGAIDELDIPAEYTFEVSSPGLARELRTDAHLARYAGKPIAIGLYKQDEKKRRELRGELVSYDESSYTLAVEGENVTIDRKDASHVKADDDTDMKGNKR